MKKSRFFVMTFIGCLLFSSIISTYSLSEEENNPSLISQTSLVSEEKQETLIIFTSDVPPSEGLEIFDILPSLDFMPINLVFDFLVTFSVDTKEPIPALAESWVVSLDSKHWTFFLRNDVLFHDGSPFNAFAVKFSYDRLINSSHPSYINVSDSKPWLESFPLSSVEIKNAFSVTFHFNEPYAPFLYNVASWFPIYSPLSFSGPNITVPSGTGPYKFINWEDDFPYSMIFSRNDDYFRGKAPFRNITYRSYPEYESFYQAVHNHDGHLGLGSVPDLPEDDNFWNLSLGGHNHELGWFNHSNTYLANSKVRSAINHAIDKKDFAETFSELTWVGLETINITSLIYLNSPFFDESVSGYPYDLDLANDLLDEAGYPRGDNGYRFTLNLAGAWWKDVIIDYVQDQLTKLGINTTVSYNTYEEWINGSVLWDIFIIGVGNEIDPSFCREFLHSSSTFNHGRFSNSYIDTLVTLGQYTPVIQERKFYYNQIQRLSQELAPYLLLMEDRKPYYRASNITSLVELDVYAGIVFNFSDQEPSEIVSMEKIPIANDSLYFQLVDTVMYPSTSHSDSTISLILTYNPDKIEPEIPGTGKFFSISSSDQEPTTYNVRFYFDKEDFNNRIDFENLMLYQWNERTQKWEEIKSNLLNTDLQYIEVLLNLSTDSLIINLGYDIFVTFQYLFPYLILIGTIISLGTAVIILNRYFANNLKEEFLLP